MCLSLARVARRCRRICLALWYLIYKHLQFNGLIFLFSGAAVINTFSWPTNDQTIWLNFPFRWLDNNLAYLASCISATILPIITFSSVYLMQCEVKNDQKWWMNCTTHSSAYRVKECFKLLFNEKMAAILRNACNGKSWSFTCLLCIFQLTHRWSAKFGWKIFCAKTKM